MERFLNNPIMSVLDLKSVFTPAYSITFDPGGMSLARHYCATLPWDMYTFDFRLARIFCFCYAGVNHAEGPCPQLSRLVTLGLPSMHWTLNCISATLLRMTKNTEGAATHSQKRQARKQS